MSAQRLPAFLALLIVALIGSQLAGEEPRIIRICGFTAELRERCQSGLPARLVAAGSIQQLIYSPDGKHLAVTRSDKDVDLLDSATGQLIRRLRDPDGPIAVAAFTPDGKFLATGGWQNPRVRLWEVASGQPIRQFELEGEQAHAADLAIAPGGRTLAVSTASTIQLWDLTTGRKLGNLQPENNWPGCLRFAPDGRSLASHSWEDLRVWNISNMNELGPSRLLYHQEALLICGTGRAEQREGVAFSRDGQRIYFGTGVHYQVQAIAARSGMPVPITGRTTEAKETVATTSFALSPDDRTLALGGRDGTIRLIEVLTGQVRARLPGHQREVLPIAFSPDGRRLASAGADKAMQFWDLTSVVPVPPGPLAGEALATAWTDLGGDSDKAFQAMQVLSGAQGMEFLQARLQPRFIAEGDVRRWIADLDSRDFPTRQAATEALEKLGRNVTPALRLAASGQTTLEVRLRLEQLLSLAEQTPRCAEDLREHRVIELLERLGTPAARQLLQKLAGGSPTAQLTELARAALAARQ